MPRSKLIREQLALLSSLAEEIGNPLTAINVRLFSLKESLGNEALGREDLAEVSKEIRRLENLLKRFLKDFKGLLESEAE